jgi:regulator of protease activity HflC (stomatin/prohibitin superfamily)
MGLFIIGFIIFIVIMSFLRQVNEYERGVVYTMGRYTGTYGAGWHVIWPIFQRMIKVDVRTKAVDIQKQEAITKDNVSCKINAVIYYKITDAGRSVNEVENVFYAVTQMAQTTMRRITGEVTLDELLSQREKIAEQILTFVEQSSQQWGIDVSAVELKDIELPESMVRTMAKQAEAEREKRAVIINSEGEVCAAENLAKAAELMAKTPGALHLRTLNSINDISSDQSNTVVFAVPMEILRAIEGLGKKLNG